MHKVKCKFCEITFDADQEPYIYIESSRRYAHETCYKNFMSQLSQNEKDYLELENYIKKLFGKDYVNADLEKSIRVTSRNKLIAEILKKYFYLH